MSASTTSRNAAAFVRPKRRVVIAATLMAGTGLGINGVRALPEQRVAAPPIDLERVIPKVFADWQHEPRGASVIVSPDAQALLDKLYAQVLNRTYLNADGYRVMLALAHGSDQRGALQAHRPEICYPAQGFVLHDSHPGTIPVEGGSLPVRRMTASLGPRHEPVTYWFTVGERAIGTGLDRKFAEMKATLTGRIPDGLLFRLSSIDSDARRAFRLHGDFIRGLLAAVEPQHRVRLSGLVAT